MFVLPNMEYLGNSAQGKPTTSTNSAKKEIDYSDFQSFYNSKYPESNGANPYGLFGRIDNFFTGNVTAAEKEYAQYLADKANKETWSREDSAVQRAMADYKAAGLNPYLLINSGSVAQAASSSAQRSLSYEKKESKSSKGLISTALKILAILALKG